MLTIPVTHLPTIPEPSGDLVHLKGQQEVGEQGLHHWQLIANFSRPVTGNQVKSFFCPQAHIEKTRSDAADAYVWKEESAVQGTRFEKGDKPLRRNNKTDWDLVRTNAKTGNFDDIDADVFVRHYSSLKRIRVDYAEPIWRENIEVLVYWGGSGLGKTRRAWHEADKNVYVKDPNTKWWDGYKGEECVIIDEFTGVIAINHILRWLDRYPCSAEVKGYSTPLRANRFWITSNLDPRTWYPDANSDQMRALLRRMKITHFLGEWVPPRAIPEDDNVHWEENPIFLESSSQTLLDLLSGQF